MDKQADDQSIPTKFYVNVPGVVHSYTTGSSSAQALSQVIWKAFENRDNFWWQGKKYTGEIGRDTLVQDILNSPFIFEYVQPLPGMESQPIQIPLSTSQPSAQPQMQVAQSRDIDDLVVQARGLGVEQVEAFVKDAAFKFNLSDEDVDALHQALFLTAAEPTPSGVPSKPYAVDTPLEVESDMVVYGNGYRCEKCGDSFSEPMWINYREYPGASGMSPEPVSPCCHSKYSEPADELDQAVEADLNATASDESKKCPECDKPNQFGELCNKCHGKEAAACLACNEPVMGSGRVCIACAGKKVEAGPGAPMRALVQRFAEGAMDGKAGSLIIMGPTIYSYGEHFPIATRSTDESGAQVAYLTLERYSQMTAQHIGLVYRTLVENGWKVIESSSKGTDENGRNIVLSPAEGDKPQLTKEKKERKPRVTVPSQSGMCSCRGLYCAHGDAEEGAGCQGQSTPGSSFCSSCANTIREKEKWPSQSPSPKSPYSPKEQRNFQQMDIEDAPASPSEVPVMDPKHRQREEDAILDQYSDSGPLQRPLLERKLRELRGWLRRADSGIYGKTFKLLKDLPNVESWNHTDDSVATIPAGAEIEVIHAHDANSTLVQPHIEAKENINGDPIPGDWKGIPVRKLDGSKPHDFPEVGSSVGYLFIVPNQILGEAIGVPIAAQTYDLTGQILAYESGELDDEGILALFQQLVNTGMAWQLQGSYGRMAAQLLEQGLIERAPTSKQDHYGNTVPGKAPMTPDAVPSLSQNDMDSRVQDLEDQLLSESDPEKQEQIRQKMERMRNAEQHGWLRKADGQ